MTWKRSAPRGRRSCSSTPGSSTAGPNSRQNACRRSSRNQVRRVSRRARAGRLAVPAGAWCLQKQNGGSGVLLPGLEGVPADKVVLLGAGNVGSNALALAHGMGAEISVFARTEKRFPALRRRFPGVTFQTGRPIIAEADLVIGGVLTPGEMSPKLVSREMLRRMRDRKGVG